MRARNVQLLVLTLVLLPLLSAQATAGGHLDPSGPFSWGRMYEAQHPGPSQAPHGTTIAERIVDNRSSCNTASPVLLLVAVVAAFCFGWMSGRQYPARHALQQALVASDDENEEHEQHKNAHTPSTKSRAQTTALPDSSSQQAVPSRTSASRAASLSSADSEYSTSDDPTSHLQQVKQHLTNNYV